MANNKLSIAIFGLAVLCASQGWAGTLGNGAAQRNGVQPVAKTHYSFCFGGLPNTAYFSPVIASAPAVNKGQSGGPFGAYLTKTYGVDSNDGGQCVTSEVMADTVRAKKQREAEFAEKKWKIVEVEWQGNP